MKILKNQWIIIISLVLAPALFATDWPMWRYDVGRTANSPEELSPELHLLWERHYPPREPVWDDPLNQDIMPFDRVFEPIVFGKQLFLGFNDCDKVVAISTETGEQQWEFFVDGPVRLPMAAWKDRLYLTSDDGWLYCLNTRDGELAWKFRGAPGDRKILGNKRLISSWPARGGVVIRDEIVYFGASIWPFMGTFLYALDAATGEIIWQNLGTGSTYMKQPHNSPAFAGVAPQGAMAISGDLLLVSAGRSVPAVFNRHTGEMIYFHLAAFNKTGGSFICANENYFLNHSRDRNTNLFDLEEGHRLIGNIGKYPVLNTEVFYFSGETITARSAKSPDDILAEYAVDATGDLIKAGSQLYAGGKNQITAFQPPRDGEELKFGWQKKVDGEVSRLIAADGKLFAVTLEGKIMAFGPEPQKARIFPFKTEAPRISRKIRKKIAQIVEQTGIKAGYALVWGIQSGELLAGLASATDLHLVALDPSAAKIQKLRKQFDQTGLYGKRISLLQGTPETLDLPPYFASLIILNHPDIHRLHLKSSYKSLRPYGGKIWTPAREEAGLKQEIAKNNLLNAEIKIHKNGTTISREGPLPGAASWTHQYGDIANSVKSNDDRVQLPLGILWFGGSSNVDVLPRHGHGPPEQVVGGKLFIPGMDRLSARDVYTGRVLWKTLFDSSLTDGMFFDYSYTNTPLVPTYNQEHIPGANARGTVFVATTDLVYVVKQDSCLVLNSDTGEQIRNFLLPPAAGQTETEWGFVGTVEQFLIAGGDFVAFSDFNPTKSFDDQEYRELSLKHKKKYDRFRNYDRTASQRLMLMNRYDGTIKWQRTANYGFIHNAIVASKSHVYCLDKLPPYFEQKFERRGVSLPDDFRLLALDIETGDILWEQNADIFGSWLGYSEEHGLLLQATRPSRDMLSGEDGKRMIVYNATTGVKIWNKKIKYKNPPILYHNQIITDRAAYDIFSGKPIERRDPLTHEIIPWTYTRTYGCNYNIASEHLLSFRSAAAGFYDLMRQGGTGNFGGFKSGCTSNLVVADGVLNAPDYTRTCQCSYQNQTSLALVHMPELEYWTNTTLEWNGKQIQQVGLNFNAPGDRLADNKTLWLDIPSVGGDSPKIPVAIEPENFQMFRSHSAFIQAEKQPWVMASAVAGVNRITLKLSEEPLVNATYTIRLHFAELEQKQAGQRVFDVLLQGRPVLRDFDIVREAGGTNIAVIKQFEGIPVERKVYLEFRPSTEAPNSQPIICGIEAIVE